MGKINFHSLLEFYINRIIIKDIGTGYRFKCNWSLSIKGGDAITGTAMEHLSVVPSTVDLLGVEVELVGREGRERILHDAVNTIRDNFRYIFIDCPPSLGILTLNALVAADSVLIPVQCEYYALEGLGLLTRTLRLIRGAYNPGIEIEGIILTIYDARLNLSKQVASDAREYFGDLVFNTVIPRNIRLAEAPSFGRPIVTYDIASVGSIAYLALAKEVAERAGTDVYGSPDGPAHISTSQPLT